MREDLQVLRGLAIGFVFLYHLLPSVFVNGFLGVDVFFVLSGFLMAKILNKDGVHKVSDVLNFYYRRFKRILPLYYLIIFITVVLVHLYLGDFYWATNRRYSVSSLFVATNQLVIHDSQDYFKQFSIEGSAKNCFIHMWSLAVEMQFYLIVPFYFFALQFLKNDTWRLIIVSITTILGFVAFSLMNPQFRFNFMPLRLWQFTAGFIALFYTEMTKTTLDKVSKDQNKRQLLIFNKEDLVVTSLLIICLSLCPYKIDAVILRPLVTFSTAIVIAAESRDNQILKSRYLVILGNISYAFYLVHWPVICIFGGVHLTNFVFCTVTTFLASILIHQLFEKVYLKLDKTPIALLIIFLIACNGGLQFSIRNNDFWKQKIPVELQKVVNENKNFLKVPWAKHPFKKVCTVDDSKNGPMEKVVQTHIHHNCRIPKGTGKISISIIGNSYSLNFAENIRESFNGNYSDVRLLGIAGCTALYADSPGAQKVVDFFKLHVETYKPDVLYVMARHPLKLLDDSKREELWVKQMNENVAFYEKFVKKVFILGSHPLYDVHYLSTFLRYVTQQPDDLESLHLDRKSADRTMRNVKRIFKRIRCNKCKVFELSQPFIEADKYLGFDRETLLTYVDNEIHFTPPGTELMRPVFEDLAKEALTL